MLKSLYIHSGSGPVGMAPAVQFTPTYANIERLIMQIARACVACMDLEAEHQIIQMGSGIEVS